MTDIDDDPLWANEFQLVVGVAEVNLVRLRTAGGDDPAAQPLRILLGSGRVCALPGSEHPTVLVPLRGCLRTTDGDGSRVLNPGRLLVVESGQRLQAIGGRSSLWLAFVAPNAVWRQLLDAAHEMPIAEPLLFPAVHAASRLIRRTAARAAREVRRAQCSTDDSVALLQFASLLAELKSRGYKVVHMVPKNPPVTLPEYDAIAEKSLKANKAGCFDLEPQLSLTHAKMDGHDVELE